MPVAEVWHLDVAGPDGACITLASGAPDVITLAAEQMAAVFPTSSWSLRHFRDKSWTLSVRKPGGEGG